MLLISTRLQRIDSQLKEQSTKFGGFLLHEHLTWKYHLRHINNKISRALFSIKQVKHILRVESLRTLYVALIQPHLTYDILAGGMASQSVVHKTELLQKRAIRNIFKANYNSHTEPLFKQSNILKFIALYEYQSSLFMKFVSTVKLIFCMWNVVYPLFIKIYLFSDNLKFGGAFCTTPAIFKKTGNNSLTCIICRQCKMQQYVFALVEDILSITLYVSIRFSHLLTSTC